MYFKYCFYQKYSHILKFCYMYTIFWIHEQYVNIVLVWQTWQILHAHIREAGPAKTEKFRSPESMHVLGLSGFGFIWVYAVWSGLLFRIFMIVKFYKNFFFDPSVKFNIIEPWQRISNNVVCATSKASDQPAHMRSLIRAFASRLNILWVLSY